MIDLIKNLKIKNTSYRNGDFEIISYTTDKIPHLIVQTKFGLCKASKSNLLRNRTPTIKSAISPTDYFRNQLSDIHPNLKLLDDYKSSTIHVRVEDKYGICKSLPANLLRGKTPNIESAIDKNSYFLNQLLEVQPNFTKKFTIISEYINSGTYLFINTKYGVCKIIPENLLTGVKPFVGNAVNSTEYFINQCEEKFNNKINYDLTQYVKKDVETTFKCVEHDKLFSTTPTLFLRFKFNCPLCAAKYKAKSNRENATFWLYSEWVELAKKSKNFESFKVYIIRCWNNTEEFYKVGRTFKKIKYRFSGKTLPYNYEIVNVFTFEDGFDCCERETELKQINKKYKYKPLIKFGGYKECFSQPIQL